MKNKFLLLFLMFSYVAILQGQQNKFNFRNINISDGLSNNTVSSTKVADARISYSGTGDLAAANKQGWASRFFNSSVWPF